MDHHLDSVDPHTQCLQWDLGKTTGLEVSLGSVLGALVYGFPASLGSPGYPESR